MTSALDYFTCLPKYRVILCKICHQLIVFGQITLVPTFEKSIAGCQKQRGPLYATNCKLYRESLTPTNNSKYHRLSISRYRVYACSRTGSNVD